MRLCEADVTEKFTYFDFQMYVLPGAILLTGLLACWVVAGGQAPELLGDSGLFASVAFILGAFVCGHFVQTMAHSLPERLLKELFWAGRYPSQILFFKGAGIISAVERDRYIALLRDRGLASDKVVACWDGEITIGRFRRSLQGIDKEQLKRGADQAQFAFHRIRNYLADNKGGLRANSAEAHYQFFRGAFTAAGLAGVSLSIEIVGLGNGWITPIAGAVDNHAPGTIVAVLFCLFAGAFFWRARGADRRWRGRLCAHIRRQLPRARPTRSQGRMGDDKRDNGTRFRAYQLGNKGSSYSYFDGRRFTLVEGRLTDLSRTRLAAELKVCGKTSIDTLHITSWDQDHCTPSELENHPRRSQARKDRASGLQTAYRRWEGIEQADCRLPQQSGF